MDGDSTPKFSMDSLQPEHTWTGWREDAVSPFYLKIDGMHHPHISKGERWIGTSSWLSILAFCFGWSCHHPTLHQIRWSWVCYATHNSTLVLAPPWVSAACAGLHRYPQRLHSLGLVAPPGLSPWWRKRGLGTCLIVVLTFIKRYPWMKKQLVGPSRCNLLNCSLPQLVD